MNEASFQREPKPNSDHLTLLKDINLACMRATCKTHNRRITDINIFVQQSRALSTWEEFCIIYKHLSELTDELAETIENYSEIQQKIAACKSIFTHVMKEHFKDIINLNLKKITNPHATSALRILFRELDNTTNQNDLTNILSRSVAQLEKTSTSNRVRVWLGFSKSQETIAELHGELNRLRLFTPVRMTRIKPYNDFIADITTPFTHADIRALSEINMRNMLARCATNNPRIPEFNYRLREKMHEIVKSPQRLNDFIVTLKKVVTSEADSAALNNLEIKSYQALCLQELTRVDALLDKHLPLMTNRTSRAYLVSLKDKIAQLRTQYDKIQSIQDYIGHLSLLHIQLSFSLNLLTKEQQAAKQTSNGIRIFFGMSNTGIYRDEMKSHLCSLYDKIKSLADYSLLNTLNVGGNIYHNVQRRQSSYINMRQQRDGGVIDTLFRQASLKEYNLALANNFQTVQQNAGPDSIHDKATLYQLLSMASDQIHQLQGERLHFLGDYWSKISILGLSMISEFGILLLPILAPIVLAGVAVGVPLTLVTLATQPSKGEMLNHIERLQNAILKEIYHDDRNIVQLKLR